MAGGQTADAITILDGFRQKYGDIYSMRTGDNWAVVLCDYDSVKEACLTRGKEFGGRTNSPIENLIRPTFPEIRGIISGDYSEEWKVQRHASLSALKELGYGKRATETKMLEEAECLKQAFQKYMGKRSFKSAGHISNAVTNVILSLLVNQRHDYDDPTFKSVRHAVDLHFEHIAEEHSYLPFQYYLPAFKRLTERVRVNYNIIIDYLKEHIKKREDAFQQDEPPSCFIDSYYQAINSSDGNMKNWIIVLLEDLILAGMETTTTTLGWAIYFMVAYPEVQSKVQEELDRVVGPDRQPVLKDRAKLPYTEATLQELLRLASTAPIGVPHKTMVDSQVKDFKIPKGCDVITFLWNVHRNPKYWPEPEVCRPERFLDEEGNVKKMENIIPFGIGRRTCLGEQLARQELFLFFTAMVQSFTLSLPEGATLPPPRGEFTFTHRPPALDICVHLR